MAIAIPTLSSVSLPRDPIAQTTPCSTNEKSLVSTFRGIIRSCSTHVCNRTHCGSLSYFEALFLSFPTQSPTSAQNPSDPIPLLKELSGKLSNFGISGYQATSMRGSSPTAIALPPPHITTFNLQRYRHKLRYLLASLSLSMTG